eukprot:maker-scaffold934_size79169-snap-gene-0.30 protein:Tk02412 transcript:maker-scaffold934_size79169-snap-gene-0.30-mRNA-1 annotation:"nucleoside diphosphate kinase b"
MANQERTFIMIKPDGVHRGLIGDIASVEHLEKHYADLKGRPFFAGLVTYMASGPVLAMVWEGLNVVATGRVMLGETNPKDSKPGVYEKGDFCIQVGRNICHGSDAVESAKNEINLWFQARRASQLEPCGHGLDM